MDNFRNTKEVIKYSVKFIKGTTLDFGAGKAKYKNIISPHTTKYETFDMAAGPEIDIVGDVLNPPFENNSFDTVISTQVLEHVQKPWIMVNQIRRILKTGGVCIMTAPFMVPYHADPHDYFRYTKEGLSSLFQNEGFEIIECKSYGKTFSVLSEMIHFVFFSHYKKRSKIKQKLISKILRIIQPMAHSLDRLVRNRVLYPNSYVIAKKK